MLWKRVTVRDQERILVAKNGRFSAILTPGSHRVSAWPGVSVSFDKFDTRDLVFHSRWSNYLVKERPDVIERHFAVVRTNEMQIAMIYADGKLFKVLTPAKCVLFWRGSVNITAEVVTVIAELATESDEPPSEFDEFVDQLVGCEAD